MNRSSERPIQTTIEVTVDGVRHEAQPGELTLSLLKQLAAKIPHVCYHSALGTLSTCDTCLVEIDGELKRACEHQLVGGEHIDTAGERARSAREEAVQRLLENHELYCTICDYNNGNCEVHEAVRLVQLRHQKYPFRTKPYEVDNSHPFYRYDPDQCIQCGRCVDACQNVQVTETLTMDWSAERPRVLWDGGRQINDSSCVSCGHCVTVCPCNALMEKSMLGRAGHFTHAPQSVQTSSIKLVKHLEQYTGFAPLFSSSEAEADMRRVTIQRTKTVCTYCGVGCAFEMWTDHRRILKVEPRPEAPANGISTCIKGKFGWDFVNSPERLTHPVVRADGKFQRASWDEALALTARRLREVQARWGSESIMFISSSKTTNEECYLVQKLARAVFGTNNVDNCARYCQSPATKALMRTVGLGGDSGTMNDIEAAELVLIIGSHTATSHPVLASRIKRRQKAGQMRVVVADLMKHELAERSDLFLRPEPGTDMIWVNAVARYILEQGMHDRAFIERRVEGFEEYRKSLEPFTLEYAAQRSGIAADTLKQLARWITETKRFSILWAMGVTQHHNGTDTSTAFSNLLLLTGNYGRPGTGAYPLRGHNNVQGSCDFGALYNFLPGYGKVEDDEARAPFEREWGVTLPSQPGWNNRTMVDAIHEGKVKALFVVGEELGLVDSNIHHVQAALRKLEFFVVQDIFMSTTAEFADIVLAGTPSLEKEGTFVNTERRIQRLYQVMPPLGESLPDWKILTELARHLGHDWHYDSPSDIMKEIARCTPIFAGVTYERLEGFRSLCWPVREDGTDSPLLYTEHFDLPAGKARFFPAQYSEPHEIADEQYPIHLNSGRVLEHFHEGNMTFRNPGFETKVADAFVFVSDELAKQYELQDGDWVRLTSRRGNVVTRAVISPQVRAHEVFMPAISSDQRVNILTSSDADPVVDTPSYKETAVRLEKLGKRGRSPLPRGNPRYGQATPQPGVMVEQKWQRPDYSLPGVAASKGEVGHG